MRFYSPPISGQLTVAADHAMTRHRDGDWIGRARAGHGSYCSGIADRACDLGIAASLAAGNLAKLLPHFLLEGGGADIEREVNGGVLAANTR